MPVYHQVGDLPSLDFLESEKAAQATLDAQRILGVDAAIMFADLLPILEPMGLHLDYLPGEVRYSAIDSPRGWPAVAHGTGGGSDPIYCGHSALHQRRSAP